MPWPTCWATAACARRRGPIRLVAAPEGDRLSRVVSLPGTKARSPLGGRFAAADEGGGPSTTLSLPRTTAGSPLARGDARPHPGRPRRRPLLGSVPAVSSLRSGAWARGPVATRVHVLGPTCRAQIPAPGHTDAGRKAMFDGRHADRTRRVASRGWDPGPPPAQTPSAGQAGDSDGVRKEADWSTARGDFEGSAPLRPTDAMAQAHGVGQTGHAHGVRNGADWLRAVEAEDADAVRVWRAGRGRDSARHERGRGLPDADGIGVRSGTETKPHTPARPASASATRSRARRTGARGVHG